MKQTKRKYKEEQKLETNFKKFKLIIYFKNNKNLKRPVEERNPLKFVNNSFRLGMF